MSRVEAYRCDFCTNLRISEEVVGILPTQDMFDKLAGFPSTTKNHKADIHLCTACYNTFAVDVADREVNRKKDEASYKLKLKEMAYLLRAQCVANYQKKNLMRSIAQKK